MSLPDASKALAQTITVLFVAGVVLALYLCALGPPTVDTPATGAKVRPMLTVPRTGEVAPIPETDADALRLLDYAHGELAQAMRGIYRAYRRMGRTPLEAYISTQREYVDLLEQALDARTKQEGPCQ